MNNMTITYKTNKKSGADLGGGGADASSQRFGPLPTHRVPLLNYFEISITILVREFKDFLKAPWAPIHFEGGACKINLVDVKKSSIFLKVSPCKS